MAYKRASDLASRGVNAEARGATSLGDTVIAGLHIAVWNDELVVSLPELDYCITYYKGPTSGWLLARDIPYRDDPHSKIKLSEFLAGASRAANDKARELGWI